MFTVEYHIIEYYIIEINYLFLLLYFNKLLTNITYI